MRLPQDHERLMRHQGFLVLHHVFTPANINEVRELLDPLFERLEDLPSKFVRDLGKGMVDSVDNQVRRSPEISRATGLEPRLTRTTVYRVCKQLASQLAGGHAWYTFDHAIYKEPFNRADTPWHQDQAYTGHRESLHTFHFWIPLQDVDERNGCMHFIPGSHAKGLLEHHRRDHNPEAHALTTDGVDTGAALACPLEVGGLTVHDPLTLHYTGPNHTGLIRRAWIIHFGPYGRLAKLKPRILLARLLMRFSH